MMSVPSIKPAAARRIKMRLREGCARCIVSGRGGLKWAEYWRPAPRGPPDRTTTRRKRIVNEGGNFAADFFRINLDRSLQADLRGGTENLTNRVLTTQATIIDAAGKRSQFRLPLLPPGPSS